jgi:CheY-like chemotaxis protein
MPKKNGFEVLAWIRQQQGIRRLIVLILTASNQTPDINQGYDLGVNSYLVKPPDLDTLTEMLRTVYSYWMGLNQCPELHPDSALVKTA